MGAFQPAWGEGTDALVDGGTGEGSAYFVIEIRLLDVESEAASPR